MVYNTIQTNLGEGLFTIREENEIFWLDINTKELFYSYADGNFADIKRLTLEQTPSCIFDKDGDELLLLDAEGIKVLNLQTSKLQSIEKIPHNTELFRGNDGVKLADGTLLFGSMARNPSENSGKIYHYKNSELVTIDLIGIPNTFIELEDSVLISDSLTQKIYKYNKETYSKTMWADFSQTTMTPDGGALSDDGYIYVCFWGGACILKLDQIGSIISKFEIPALQPTNCKFISSNELIVTTATEGMTKEQICQYPKSGMTLKVTVGAS